MEDLDLTELKHLPFQAQIEYTALDGSHQVRVITKRLEISNDLKDLEKKANYEILGMNAVQQSNKYARQGDYRQAQVISKAWDMRMQKNYTCTSAA